MNNKHCVVCGNNLTGRQTKYCCIECKRQGQSRQRCKYDKVCPSCGNDFKGARPEQIYCNRSCKASYENRLLTGEHARNWKGGRVIDPRGYIKVYNPDSPLSHKDGYVYEHREIANKRYPFNILSNFPVHHLNGDRSDNHPDNLKVLGGQDRHIRQYHSGRKHDNI